MRKVKYQDTGEYGSNESGYQAPNKKYYSSKEAYDLIVKNKELYKEVYIKLQEILETSSVPPIVIKEVNKYKARYDIVLEILERTGEIIREGLRTRNITNSFCVARYVGTFINNNYREIEKEFEELVTVKKQRHIEEPEDMSHIGHKHKHKDLSQLTGVI